MSDPDSAANAARVKDETTAAAQVLRLAQALRTIRDTTSPTSAYGQIAARALIDAGVPDPPEEDHPCLGGEVCEAPKLWEQRQTAECANCRAVITADNPETSDGCCEACHAYGGDS